MGEKVEVAKQILRAPKNSNGQNLCPNVEKSPAAYLSSVIASVNDPHVENFFDGLHVPIIDSYDRYVTMTDLDPTKPSPVSSIIVSDKSKLLSTQYISRIFKKFHTRFGIMGVLTRFCQSIRLQALRQSGVNLAESNEGSMTRQTRSDAIHILASTTRGRLGGLACADLAFWYNRIESDSFRAIMCYYLNLPYNALYDGDVHPDFGYPVQHCPADDQFFDSCGDHASSCKYCHSTRSATHTWVRNIMISFLVKAGFLVTSEPSSFNLVRNLFTSASQLTALFPKTRDAVAAKRRAALQEQLPHIITLSNRDARKAIDAIVSDNHGDSDASTEGVHVRADIHAVPANGKGPGYLIDGTAIHPTPKDLGKKQLKFLLETQKRSNNAFNANYRVVSNTRDSPVVQAAVKLKHKTYGLIETLANVQAAGFGASRPVKLVAAAVTHQGEMSNEFLNLITKAVGRYRSNLRLYPDIDGNTASKAATIYRSSFKGAVCAQMARGFGRQLLATAGMSLAASISS